MLHSAVLAAAGMDGRGTQYRAECIVHALYTPATPTHESPPIPLERPALALVVTTT